MFDERLYFGLEETKEVLDILAVPSSLVRLVGRMDKEEEFENGIIKWGFYAGATFLEAVRMGEYYSRVIKPFCEPLF